MAFKERHTSVLTEKEADQRAINIVTAILSVIGVAILIDGFWGAFRAMENENELAAVGRMVEVLLGMAWLQNTVEAHEEASWGSRDHW